MAYVHCWQIQISPQAPDNITCRLSLQLYCLYTNEAKLYSPWQSRGRWSQCPILHCQWCTLETRVWSHHCNHDYHTELGVCGGEGNGVMWMSKCAQMKTEALLDNRIMVILWVFIGEKGVYYSVRECINVVWGRFTIIISDIHILVCTIQNTII